MTHYFPTYAPDDMRAAYLDLLKRSLMGWPYAKLGYKITAEDRLEGKDWPDDAMTLLSLSRLNNIQECMETCLKENIPGDFMECGVWRGGACILMRGVLHAYGVTDRTVIMADSFDGVPAPHPNVPQDKNETFHRYGYLAVDEVPVVRNFARYGLEERIAIVKGLFKNTLPGLNCQLAVLRIDGDLYESTMDCLVNLYPKLSKGGFVIIDDFVCFPHTVGRACEDYRKKHNITQEIAGVDWSAAYWRKL